MRGETPREALVHFDQSCCLPEPTDGRSDRDRGFVDVADDVRILDLRDELEPAHAPRRRFLELQARIRSVASTPERIRAQLGPTARLSQRRCLCDDVVADIGRLDVRTGQ